MRLTSRFLTGLLSVVALLSGCQVTAPRELPPVVATPALYAGNPAATDTASISDLPWQTFFADSALVGLIDTALAQNLDLRVAVQRVEQARATWLERRAPLLPTVNGVAAAGLDHYGDYTLNGVGNFDTNLSQNVEGSRRIPTTLTPDYFLGFRASWELDLWGKLRSRRKAAYLRLLASVEGKNLVITSLVAEVARNYYELLTLDNQLAALERNAALQSRALEMTRVQKQAGRATELAVQQFAAQLLRTRSLSYEVSQRITETENQLNQLLGRYPRPIGRGRPLARQELPTRLVAGLPSHLLLRRPDVRQAELELSAAHADVNAARAAFLPSLTLTPYLGFNAFRTAQLLNPASLAYGALAGLSAPVFNRRLIRAEYNRSVAQNLENYYDYQKAIQTGFREVSNNLRGLENYRQVADLRQQEVETLNKAIATATDLQLAGYATYLEVITAQRSALDAELSLAEVRRTQFLQAIDLYRALGGGWAATPVPAGR